MPPIVFSMSSFALFILLFFFESSSWCIFSLGTEVIAVSDPERRAEICLEDYNYNYQVDVWSLGCVLYELLTKKILFEERFDILKRQIEILGLKKFKLTFD